MEIAAKFEAGKNYINNSTTAVKTIERRTACYVWVDGKKLKVVPFYMPGFNEDGSAAYVESFKFGAIRYCACCECAWEGR